jgi:deoxycytidylate deaminase
MAINFNRLEEISRALKPLHQTGKKFHTCFAYHGNKLISIAANDYSKLHPAHKWGEYKNTKFNGEYCSGVHAEVKNLIKLGLEDCSHLTFVNIRIDNNGEPAISKPCANCERVLRQIKIRQIWYYDGEKYVKEKY